MKAVRPSFFIKTTNFHTALPFFRSTIFRIRDYWIPLVHETVGADKHKMPLILVGNKSDTDEISVLIDSVLSIMNDFPEVSVVPTGRCLEIGEKLRESDVNGGVG